MHESEVAESWPTLHDPKDCSPPGSSSLHGLFQARVLEWVTIAFSTWAVGPNYKQEDLKKAKIKLPLLRGREQWQGPARDPCTQHHQGEGRPSKLPLRPNHPHPILGTSCPPQGGIKGTCCLPSLPPAAAQAPVKPCLNSCSGLSSVSIIKESKDPGDDPSRQAQTLVLERICSLGRDLGRLLFP